MLFLFQSKLTATYCGLLYYYFLMSSCSWQVMTRLNAVPLCYRAVAAYQLSLHIMTHVQRLWGTLCKQEFLLLPIISEEKKKRKVIIRPIRRSGWALCTFHTGYWEVFIRNRFSSWLIWTIFKPWSHSFINFDHSRMHWNEKTHLHAVPSYNLFTSVMFYSQKYQPSYKNH